MQEDNDKYSVAPDGYFQLGARLNPRTGQPYDTTLISKGFHIELQGSPVTEERDIDYVMNIFSARDPEANCARFILSGPEGGRPIADSHQHAVIQLKSPKRIRFQQILNLPSGKQVMVYAVNLTEYSQATGDIEKLIEYIKKHDTQIIRDTKNEQLLKQAEDEKNQKGRTERIWQEALQQYPMEIALNTLKLLGPRQYAKEIKDFGLTWQKKWNRQVWLDATYKPKLKPWHDDGSLTEINDWVKRNSPNKIRGGNLFVVGPSKTGKSEYIIQEVCRKYNCYYIKGLFDWTNYNNEENYKFYVFDDVTYNKDSLEAIKALTSGINIPTNINVKYSMAFVKCRPCIHILNDHEYQKFMNLAYSHGGMEWWGKNSKTVFITKPVFKLDSEVLEEKMELENTMSENSVEFNDQEIDQDDEQEEGELTDNEEHEKEPKKPYSKQKSHSFRSRFKHALRYVGKDEDDVQEILHAFDEKMLKDLRELEKIEYGFEEEDDEENHDSMIQEKNIDNIDEIRKETLEQQVPIEPPKRQRKRPVYLEEDYEDDDYDDDDLPPSTRGFSSHENDGIIYDRFED